MDTEKSGDVLSVRAFDFDGDLSIDEFLIFCGSISIGSLLIIVHFGFLGLNVGDFTLFILASLGEVELILSVPGVFDGSKLLIDLAHIAAVIVHIFKLKLLSDN